MKFLKFLGLTILNFFVIISIYGWFIVDDILVYVLIAVVLAATVASALLTKKPPNTSAAAKTLETPTTEIGTPVPVLFGTRLIKSPVITWWGPIRIVKRKLPTGTKK